MDSLNQASNNASDGDFTIPSNVNKTPDIFVLNRTGGVGKSTVTQILNRLLVLKKYKNFSVISIDSSEAGDSASYLSRRIAGTIPLAIPMARFKGAQTTEDMLQHWLTLTNMIGDGILVDFGANTSDGFIQYLVEMPRFRKMFAGKNVIKPLLVVPVTTKYDSVHDAVDMLKQLIPLKDDMPFGKIFIVYNEKEGLFPKHSVPVIDELETMSKKLGAVKVKITRCPTDEGMDFLNRHFMGFEDLFAESDEGWMEKTGYKYLRALNMKDLLEEWVDEGVKAFNEAGI